MTTDFRCELHVHSTYSDGKASPEQILERAAQIGLAVLAITDHDNTRGSRIACAQADRYGIEVIPAVEFTSRWDGICGPGTGLDVDVLGYGLDLDHPALQAREQAALADINVRIGACCDRLTARGLPVTLEEAFAENPQYAGLRHLCDILARKGFAADNAEAGRLVHPEWEAGPLCRFTLAEQVDVIHAAGGVAVVAHPLYQCAGEPLTADHVAALVEMGIDGLEVYHRYVDEPLRAHFQALADRFHLLVTGGSDEHGWQPDLPLLGTSPVTRAMVDALRARTRGS